ncbi:hypothetical protein DH2020_045588 [Rehmannia glutinosa]|uniref:GDSL esterase/lipase n=1 Tax=Rehmannia glutinosa TaxID=99300 RepID=A0ABR0UDS1_REHGL
MKNVVMKVVEGQGRNQSIAGPQTQHPDDFHVCGPRNVPSMNWKDLINSTWKDGNYKRTVIACFIQAVYLLELDRQENRTNENALAPKWWTPYKYKLVETLIDEARRINIRCNTRMGSCCSLSGFVPMRPNGAPRAVLAFRGTLLKSPTIRRDIEDDLRLLAWESLKGSVRFSCGLKALRSISDKYGSSNICVAGHSLGAGFALQVGKALAKQGIYVEAHLFNPPSVSLSSSIQSMDEKAADIWKRVRSMLPSNGENQGGNNDGSKSIRLGSKQWVPNLYVNNSDYICCYYKDPDGAAEVKSTETGNANLPTNNAPCAAKLFVFSKGKQKFLEAHGLEQWWSDELELQMALNNSKLISRQLKSLYSLPP